MTQKKTIVALGYFDCLHRGHRKLIETCQRIAAENGAIPAVFTFDDGFLYAIHPGAKNIYTLKERVRLLKEIGIDEVLVGQSDASFFGQSGEEFLGSIVSDRKVSGFVAGADFRYGKGAEQSVEELRRWGKKNGYSVKIVDLIAENGIKISSRNIRRLIAAGDLPRANQLLGAPYRVWGHVIHGRGVGKGYGVPTANIGVEANKLLPASGVYETEVAVGDGTRYRGLTNIGAQPTFGVEQLAVETLLLDFEGDLYGQEICLTFVRKIRDIRKFESKEALKEQIGQDIALIRGGKEL